MADGETGERQDSDSGQRLQVFLAHAGLASRRAAEGIITAGRVSVNGVTVSVLGSRVFPGDIVLVDGQPVQKETRRVYLALNKPPGYICSSSDPQGRPLALDLLPKEISERMYNVGRLDFLSCGLIFFTNDGGFAARLGHPGSGLEKEYLVEATGHIPDEAVLAFQKGITIEGVHYQAHSAARTASRSLRIVLIEGKNREIRRVFSHFHLHPSRLRRVRIGPVKLGNLAEGESRPLTEVEVEALQKKGSGEWGVGSRVIVSKRNRLPVRSDNEHEPHSPLPPEKRTRTGERVIKQRQHGVGQVKAAVTTKAERPSDPHSPLPIPYSPQKRNTTW